ncbi:hypothetical protein LTR17_005534 [Elasticomyces elasticus]|nr:hypothetical protein LTR17_005534 [Elasticomyces elasticus]
MAGSPHSEIIAVLTELYSLLVQLAAISDSLLVLPSPETGLHAPNAINTAAAKAAGYAEGTVAVMCALPYLDVGMHEYDVELLPNTYAVSYLGSDVDRDGFNGQRDMLEGKQMPPTAVKLTWAERRDGTEFIYDTATQLVIPWNPVENPDEVDDYSHVPAVSPREAFGPLIKEYRSLNYLGAPNGMEFNEELFSESGGEAPADWGLESARRWRMQYDEWFAVRKLKAIYLECGWDPDAVEQIDFRRSEFLQKRGKYWREEVEDVIARNDFTR